MVRRRIEGDATDTAGLIRQAQKGDGETVSQNGQLAHNEYARLRSNLRRAMQKERPEFRGVSRTDERAAYIEESQSVARQVPKGRIPAGTRINGHPAGTTLPRGWQVSSTSSGAVRVIDQRGRIVKGGQIRGAYRGKGGIFAGARIVDPVAFRESVAEWGKGFFGKATGGRVKEAVRVAKGLL